VKKKEIYCVCFYVSKTQYVQKGNYFLTHKHVSKCFLSPDVSQINSSVAPFLTSAVFWAACEFITRD